MVLAVNAALARVLLLDVEGTTTPADFVYRTLFPYARVRMKEFLLHHRDAPDVRADLDALRQQLDMDPEFQSAWRDDSPDAEVLSAADYAAWLMDCDSKCTPLKSLQARIWQEGYRSGELRGEVFPDVPPAFARWSRQKKAICIFSSGSVLAQQLLFATTSSGDLTPFISSYFDTMTGAKTEPESYRRIAASLGSPAPEIFFISDTVRELDSARQAGMASALCARSAGSPTPASAHSLIHTFDEVFP